MTKSLPMVVIRHQLPGRLRLTLNPGSISPRRLTAAVKGHPGILDQKYNEITRSLLIFFDPQNISSREIVFRTALALSLENDGCPILLREANISVPSSELALVSGAALVTAGLARFSQVKLTTMAFLDKVAGFSSVAAIIQHGWNEARNRGTFDPEVLSVFYLLSSMARGEFFRTAMVTWTATFVRHWLSPEDQGALLRPVIADNSGKPRVREVRLEPPPTTDQASRWFNLLRTIIRTALAVGGGHPPGTILEEIRNLSRAHGRILEGLGSSRREVTVQID